MNRRTLLAALAAASARAAVAQPAKRLVFTAIPDQDETRLVERFGRVATYLEAVLGTPVGYVPVKRYPAAVTAFTNDQVQLAWFGGFTGVQARRAVPGSEAIAQGVEDTAFTSYFIANAATGLTRGETLPAGIAGRSFSFGARASTSGRVMPEFYIRKQFGQTPAGLFSRVRFSGDHTRTLASVQSGAFELGAMDFSVFGLEQQAGRVDPAKVSVIWQTPPFPDYNWTIRGDVDRTFGAGFKERVRAALLAVRDPAILTPFARSGFIAAKNADYDPVESVANSPNCSTDWHPCWSCATPTWPMPAGLSFRA
jgi:phosphonate transport system substrate-binding protein